MAGAADEAEAFLAARGESDARLGAVAALIEGYETPFGMELLSTVHWVATHESGAAQSDDDTVRAVHAWSERNATTMKPEPIRAAWSHLKQHGWLTRALPSTSHA